MKRAPQDCLDPDKSSLDGRWTRRRRRKFTVGCPLFHGRRLGAPICGRARAPLLASQAGLNSFLSENLIQRAIEAAPPGFQLLIKSGIGLSNLPGLENSLPFNADMFCRLQQSSSWPARVFGDLGART